MPNRGTLGWLFGLAALFALTATILFLSSRRAELAQAPMANDAPEDRREDLREVAEPVREELARLDTTELRELGLDVLEAFRVPMIDPRALPEHVRRLLLARRGVADLEEFSELDANDRRALASFLSANGQLLDGWMDELTDLVIAEERWEWAGELVEFLARRDEPAARAQALRMAGWAVARALDDGPAGIEAFAAARASGVGGTQAWDAVGVCLRRLSDAPHAEVVPFLTAVGRSLELNADQDWSSDGRHPDWIAWQSLSALARIDSSEAVASLRGLLDSSSVKARQAAANAAVAAISEGEGTLLLESLGPWASDVIYGLVAAPRENLRLAWVVFAGKGDEALAVLRDAELVPGDWYEQLAWNHAVLRAARFADPEVGRRAVRDLFERPRGIVESRNEDLGCAAYATLAEVGTDEDWSWICERARSSSESALLVLQGIPAERWRPHVTDLERLLADLAAREDSDGSELGLFTLAEIAPELLPAFEASPNAAFADNAGSAARVATATRDERAFEALSKELEGLEPQDKLPRVASALDALPRSQRSKVEALLVQLGEELPCEEVERALRGGFDSRTRAFLLTGLLRAPSRGRCGVETYREPLAALAGQVSEARRSRWDWPSSLLRAMAILAVLEGREERAVVVRALEVWPGTSGSPKDKSTGVLAIDQLRTFLERAEALGADRTF